MNRKIENVLILGAGASGLTAAHLLAESGFAVTVLEARDRIGGRIYTVHDSQTNLPIEYGAEFVHGKSPEIFDLAETAQLTLYDSTENHQHVEKGKLVESQEYWVKLEQMNRRINSYSGRDQSFQSFLESHEMDRKTKSVATLFVEGFNAARADTIGVHFLKEMNRASDKIEGEKAFRILGGYDAMLHFLFKSAIASGCQFHLKTTARKIRWKKHSVQVEAITENGLREWEASRLIITLPLGVLQETQTPDAIEFSPEIPEKRDAASKLKMGQVIKVVIRFQKRFWEGLKLPSMNGNKSLADFGFLHSPDALIPTWWTQLPARTPILVGWTGGTAAESLVEEKDITIVDSAIDSLSAILKVPRKKIEAILEEIYFHNWHSDPFARGAYSYVPAGGLPAQTHLAKPVERTLFFAGEATNSQGHCGTVHGAIATGQRVAREIMK